MTPCIPSPCGANAICNAQNGVGSCQCLPDYSGNPYEGCRPECVVSSDCPSNKACVNSKCQNPCPGVCAHNAECKVLNHVPSCHCGIGFTGNPYSYCNFIQNERKLINFTYSNCDKKKNNTESLTSNIHKNSYNTLKIFQANFPFEITFTSSLKFVFDSINSRALTELCVFSFDFSL